MESSAKDKTGNRNKLVNRIIDGAKVVVPMLGTAAVVIVKKVILKK